jgi:hypothetical protein
VGDTRDAFEILIELSDRMGFLDDFNGYQNMASGFTQQPRYQLEPGKRYSVDEYWDRVAK